MFHFESDEIHRNTEIRGLIVEQTIFRNLRKFELNLKTVPRNSSHKFTTETYTSVSLTSTCNYKKINQTTADLFEKLQPPARTEHELLHAIKNQSRRIVEQKKKKKREKERKNRRGEREGEKIRLQEGETLSIHGNNFQLEGNCRRDRAR